MTKRSLNFELFSSIIQLLSNKINKSVMLKKFNKNGDCSSDVQNIYINNHYGLILCLGHLRTWHDH